MRSRRSAAEASEKLLNVESRSDLLDRGCLSRRSFLKHEKHKRNEKDEKAIRLARCYQSTQPKIPSDRERSSPKNI